MWKSLISQRAVATVAEGSQISIIHRYEALVAEGVLKPDPSQVKCIGRLQGLLEDLYSYGQNLKVWENKNAAYQTERQNIATRIRRELEAAEGQNSTTDSNSLWSVGLSSNIKLRKNFLLKCIKINNAGTQSAIFQ